jgi:hypothetical protein
MADTTTQTHRVVSKGDYLIRVVDCTDGLGLFAGLVFVQVPGERACLLASLRSLDAGRAFALAHRWLEHWTEGDYRVQRPTMLDATVLEGARFVGDKAGQS